MPVLQSEVSPKAARGRFVCFQLSLLNLGIMIAYWVGYGFTPVTGSIAWRIPVALQVSSHSQLLSSVLTRRPSSKFLFSSSSSSSQNPQDGLLPMVEQRNHSLFSLDSKANQNLTQTSSCSIKRSRRWLLSRSLSVAGSGRIFSRQTLSNLEDVFLSLVLSNSSSRLEVSTPSSFTLETSSPSSVIREHYSLEVSSLGSLSPRLSLGS